MRALVTGGAGFIGSHVAEALVARGDEVVVLDDLSTGTWRNLEPLAVTCVEGSVLDEALLDDALAGADVCFHLASSVGVRLICERPLASLTNNLRGAETVLAAATRHRCRLVLASSSAVYGRNCDGPLNERAPLSIPPLSAPLAWYATAKLAGEALALGHHRERGTQTVVVRIFNAVGTRQSAAYGMVLPRFVTQALEGRDVTVYGDGTQARCFTHVQDIVDGLLALAGKDAAVGLVFNAGDPRPVSVAELAREVVRRTASDSRIVRLSLRDVFGADFEDLGLRVPDTSAIAAAVGWAPRRSVWDAVDEAIAHHRAQLLAGAPR